MKVIDCYWEQVNIGKRTVEMTVEAHDSFSVDLFEDAVNDYEYLVVKVPMNRPSFNFGLSNMGFVCIECQLTVSKAYKDFDFFRLSSFYDRTSFEVVNSEELLNSVLTSITPGMFSTDRISLDSHFGLEIACCRYKNWLTTEYKKGKSRLIRVMYDGQHVGFMLIRVENQKIDLLLNGLYKHFQGQRLGLLTPSSPLMYVRKENIDVSEEMTCISSNNIPVVKLYDRLGFHLDEQHYVFVKHQ